MNLEFFIKLREMVSSGLVKMADTARKTTSAIKGTNDTLSHSYDMIKRKISELESVIGKSTSIKQIREARRELEQLQRISARAPGNLAAGSGGSGIMGMARSFIGPLAIGASVAGIFGAGAKQEQDIVGLRTFLGQKGAEEAYANIRNDAAATPFSVDSLLEVNRALITTGLSADKARVDTMNLANAIAASGKGNDELMRMAANMQQIKNVGKATAMDIKQFGMAGINIYQVLANATGKSIDQVREMDVSYELLSEALDKAGKKGGIFAGALEAQSKTVMGRWSTFKDSISLGAADIGTALQPLMHSLLDIGLAITETVIPAVVQFVNWVKENWNWLSLLVSVIGGAIVGYYAYMAVVNGVALATQAWTAVQWLLNAAMTANPIGIVVVAIGALVGAIIWAWNKFEGFRGVMYGVWEVAKKVGEMFIGLGKIMIGSLTFNPSMMMDGVNQLKDAALSMGNAWNTGYDKGIASMQKGGSVSTSDAKGTDVAGAYTAAKASKATTGDEAVKGIAGSGPRVIHINGVKFTDKIEIHTTNLREGADDIKKIFDEYLLRILNSGAAVQ